MTPRIMSVLVASLCGCDAGPLLTVTVDGGKARVFAGYTTPGDGVDCIFCPQAQSHGVIDCTESGGPTCSGRMPAGQAFGTTVTPGLGFFVKNPPDCPMVMPNHDVACSVQIAACSSRCPTCSGPPALDASNGQQMLCPNARVHLTGSNLGSGDICVTWGGKLLPATGDDRSLDFTVDGPGTELTLETSGGRLVSQLLTVQGRPEAKAVMPESGLPGSTLTLTGFDLTGASVTFESWDTPDKVPLLPLTVTSSLAGTLTAIVPQSAVHGMKYAVNLGNTCFPTVLTSVGFTVR